MRAAPAAICGAVGGCIWLEKSISTTKALAALAHRATEARNSLCSFRLRSMELSYCALHLRRWWCGWMLHLARNTKVQATIAQHAPAASHRFNSALVRPKAPAGMLLRPAETAARRLSLISRLQLASDKLPLVAHRLVGPGIDAAWDKALSSRPRCAIALSRRAGCWRIWRIWRR